MVNLEEMTELAKGISIDTTTIDFYGIHTIPHDYTLEVVPENKPAMNVENGEVFLSLEALERLSKTRYSGF